MSGCRRRCHWGSIEEKCQERFEIISIEVTVSMTRCQRAGSCRPIGTRDANQSCEGNYLRDAHVELFVQCLESQMERHEGCSLKMQKWKEKGQHQVKLWDVPHERNKISFVTTNLHVSVRSEEPLLWRRVEGLFRESSKFERKMV